MSNTARRTIKLMLDSNVVDEAAALNINISRAAQAGIAKAIAHETSRLWLEENAKAIESSHEYVDKNGLPLAKYRQF